MDADSHLEMYVETDARLMLAFANLAAESLQKKQQQGELRFLLLAGAAACRGGYPNVTEQCYQRAVSINPHHLLAKYDSFADAMRSEDFLTLISRLDRFCTYEHAELLLEKINPNWQEVSGDVETQCLEILGHTS